MPKPRKHNYGALWAAALLFGACYGLNKVLIGTSYADRAVPLAITLAVALSLPFGSRASSVLRGALRGLGLGCSGSLGIMAELAERLPISVLVPAALTALLTSMLCCAAGAALFAYLAEKRRTQ